MVMGTAAPRDVTCFCQFDKPSTAAVLNYLVDEGSSYRPTLLQITQAAKATSDTSAAPFLGGDTTIPQFRAATHGPVIRPRQDEYLVWGLF